MLVHAFNSQATVRAVLPGSRLATASRTLASSVQATEVDEELDAALNGLLGETFSEIEGTHMEDSKPIPEALLATVRQPVQKISPLTQSSF